VAAVATMKEERRILLQDSRLAKLKFLEGKQTPNEIQKILEKIKTLRNRASNDAKLSLSDKRFFSATIQD